MSEEIFNQLKELSSELPSLQETLDHIRRSL